MVAICSLGVFSIASGRSSLNDIQSIAPAANPNPRGNNGWNADTNKNAGTAINGWGREEKIDHQTAFHGLIPLGTMTDAIASHSGIFWIPITSATKSHNFQLGPNANPIAIPSVPECTVMIARKSNNSPAVLPLVFPKVIFHSCLCTSTFAPITIAIPINIPKKIHRIP